MQQLRGQEGSSLFLSLVSLKKATLVTPSIAIAAKYHGQSEHQLIEIPLICDKILSESSSGGPPAQLRPHTKLQIQPAVSRANRTPRGEPAWANR